MPDRLIHPPPAPPTNRLKNWLRLVTFLKPYKGRFAAGILFGMLNGVTSLGLITSIPNAFVTVFGDHATSSSLALGIILLVPAVMLAKAFTGYASTYFMSWVGLRVITDLRQKVFSHMQGLSLDFYTRSNVGDLISRINNDCQQAQSAVTTVIADAVKHPFTIVIVAGYLLYQNWQFSLASVLLAPLCILPIAIYGRKVRRTSKLAQENQGDIISCLHENITGARVVKAFHMEEYEKRKFWETCYRQFSYQMKIVRSVNILSPLIEIVASLGAAAAFYYAWKTQIPLETFLALMIGISQLYEPIKNLSKIHTTIQKSLASTDRVLAILDAKSSVVEAHPPKELPPIQRELQIEGVCFQYDADPVLKGISLTIAHGQTVALVGPSGAGKTTLLNLIPRFYDPSSGKIFVDGVDVRSVSLNSLRKQIAIVTQDTILFNDTIRNNIRYGSMEATDEQVAEAAKCAHAHTFILHQPFGYDTIVGDKGVKLSGGQKQRLAIARAILKNPSILLLDEAMASLDTESERAVQAALDALIKGRTTIVIAHRLSTVQNADLIVVLEDGRILEQGKHQELLNKNSLYRKLYDLQFREV